MGIFTALILLWLVFAPGPAGAGPPIVLKDTRGQPFRIFTSQRARPTALLFIGHDCPISNKYSPEINRIVAEFGSRISFYIIYPDPDLKPADARKHAAEYGYRCPALLDPDHKAVKRAGATITPEAALFDPAGRLAYRGRIDDTFVDFGKRRDAPTRRDLRLALTAVLNGKKIAPNITRPVGCFIPGPV